MIRKPSNGAFPKTEKSVLLWPPTISGVQLYQRMRIRLPRFSMHGQLINLLLAITFMRKRLLRLKVLHLSSWKYLDLSAVLFAITNKITFS